jgi:chromosome segregation ATPase
LLPYIESKFATESSFVRSTSILTKLICRAGGTEEELKEAELSAKEAFEAQSKSLEMFQTVIQQFTKMLVLRRTRWKQFQHFITLRAQVVFNYLLAERSFAGGLEFNHSQKTLELKVEPDISRAGKKGRQVKTLSGGEKSFSTVCLLLALWEAMGSPIRCLDEL